MKIEPRYVVPLLTLSALTVAFFLTRRFRPLRPGLALGLRLVAAVPLVVSGSLHLVRPGVYVSLLPPPLPRQAWLIVATGLPEILGAAGLFVPQTRRAAALCLAVFMIAIFPANVHVAGHTVHGLPMPTVPVRTAMQAAYIVLLLVAGWGVPLRRRLGDFRHHQVP
jgi:uncharacterized membrane protein